MTGTVHIDTNADQIDPDVGEQNNVALYTIQERFEEHDRELEDQIPNQIKLSWDSMAPIGGFNSGANDV